MIIWVICLLLMSLVILMRNRLKIWGYFFRNQFWKCIFCGSNFGNLFFEGEIFKKDFWEKNFENVFFKEAIFEEEFWKCIANY